MSEAPDILLLEDDLAILEGLVECLELEGHRVHAASDGAEALVWLAAGNQPRLVVLDLVMPRMGGEEFLRELRARPGARVPVVLMTAASLGSLALPEVDAFLAKPFELDEFLTVVRRFLG
jgi:CheY-like chemotaxis protein